MPSQTFRFLACVLALGTFSISGCSINLNQDPKTTVTIKIEGATTEAKRDQIAESLKEMVDGSSHSMSATWSNNSYTIKLSPVTDVDAFEQGIDFGKVKRVSDRVISVTLSE